jgi:hypothetical protein
MCLLRFTITISACRSDAEILGPQNQYLPKIISIFAEVILICALICFVVNF